MFKRFTKMLCTTLLAALMFTGCNPSSGNGGAANSSGSGSSSADGTNTKATMGRYVQKEMTPPNLENATLLQFNRKSDGTLLLGVSDSDTEQPRVFLRQGEEWTEQDNKPIVDFLGGKKYSAAKAYCDYDGNWWAGLTDESGKLAIYKIDKEGKSTEVVVPYIQKTNENGETLSLINIQPNESGKICISLLNHNVGACWAIVDTATGEVSKEIEPIVPDYHPFLKDDKLYAYDFSSKAVNTYDIISGSRVESIAIPIELGSDYAVDDQSQIVYADMDGIHRFAPNGSVVQTVVDNRSFAYASTDMGQKWALLPGEDNTFWMASQENGVLDVYYYVIDMTLPTAFDKKLYVWSMSDNLTLRGAATIFSQQNPDCEVVLEYGRTGEASGITDEDIIKGLNTRLLAGKAPDVLILDGLPIAALIEKGMLSPLENIVDEKDYYTNILNCYQKDGKSYAYPTTFKIPVLVGSGSTYDITKTDSLEQLATLYKDKKAISNISYLDVFDTAYTANSARIFKDGKTLDEAVLKDFLTQTKAMVVAQGITEEHSDAQFSSGSSKGSIDRNPVPSIISFRQNKAQCATGMLERTADGLLLFLTQKEVNVEPHPGNGFLPQNISSIPTDAANKELAAGFIKILLSERSMQIGSIDSAFPVRKEFRRATVDEIMEQVKEQGDEDMQFMCDPQQFDWDGLIAKYETPSNPEAFLRETVYEQAKLLYTNQVDVDTAAEHILSKTRLYFAEKQ